MDKQQFCNYLSSMQVDINDYKQEQFDKYYKVLVEWNEFMNLTGITEYEEVQIKHFADSLALKEAVDKLSDKYKDIKNVITFDNNMSIIDVGTGAGFPGLPLKIAFDKCNTTLLDSLNKRVKFLNEVITQLELKGIEAVHYRAEEGARKPEYREQFTVAVSRAVANLSTLSEYCMPFVKVGGYFTAYKSGDIDEELKASENAINKLGGKVECVYRFSLPQTDIERSIVFIKKIKNIAKKYPRRAGLPSKEPLN